MFVHEEPGESWKPETKQLFYLNKLWLFILCYCCFLNPCAYLFIKRNCDVYVPGVAQAVGSNKVDLVRQRAAPPAFLSAGASPALPRSRLSPGAPSCRCSTGRLPARGGTRRWREGSGGPGPLPSRRRQVGVPAACLSPSRGAGRGRSRRKPGVAAALGALRRKRRRCREAPPAPQRCALPPPGARWGRVLLRPRVSGAAEVPALRGAARRCSQHAW